MTTTELLKKIEEEKPWASLDVSTVPHYDRSLAEVRRNRAQEEVFVLTQEYRKRVKANAAAILLKGPNQAEFAKMAEEIGGTITLDMSKFYRDLIAGVWASTGNGMFTVTHILAVQNRLQQISQKHGMSIFTMPFFNMCVSHVHPTEEDLFRIFREECRGMIGNSLAVAELIKQLQDTALAQKNDKPVVPVVVLNAIDVEISSLREAFDGKLVVVEVPEVVTEESVIEAFTTLKNQLKPKE